jgi:hypothetical protein
METTATRPRPTARTLVRLSRPSATVSPQPYSQSLLSRSQTCTDAGHTLYSPSSEVPYPSAAGRDADRGRLCRCIKHPATSKVRASGPALRSDRHVPFVQLSNSSRSWASHVVRPVIRRSGVFRSQIRSQTGTGPPIPTTQDSTSRTHRRSHPISASHSSPGADRVSPDNL